MADQIGFGRDLFHKEGQYVISKLDLKLKAEVSKFDENFEKVKSASKIQDEINKRISHLKNYVKSL